MTDANGNTVTANYFAVSGNGLIDIKFAASQLSFALLWGSVDTANTISLFASNVAEGAVIGSDVSNSPAGDQGFGGSEYTLINSAVAFNELKFTSTSPTFEFALLETDPNSTLPVAEPASMAILGFGLLGLAGLRRKSL